LRPLCLLFDAEDGLLQDAARDYTAAVQYSPK